MSHEAESFAQRECDVITARPIAQKTLRAFASVHRTPTRLGSVLLRQTQLASLQQVSSPNSQDNFQICCADMNLVRLLANFAWFCVFLWISWDFADLLEIRSSATTQNIRSPGLETKSQWQIIYIEPTQWHGLIQPRSLSTWPILYPTSVMSPFKDWLTLFAVSINATVSAAIFGRFLSSRHY